MISLLGHLRPDVRLNLGWVEYLLVAQHAHQVGHLHLRLVRGDQAQPTGTHPPDLSHIINFNLRLKKKNSGLRGRFPSLVLYPEIIYAHQEMPDSNPELLPQKTGVLPMSHYSFLKILPPPPPQPRKRSTLSPVWLHD